MYFLLISVILNPKPFYLLVHSVLLCSQMFSGSCKYLLPLSTKISLGLSRKYIRTSVGFILKTLPIHLYSPALNNCLWRGALSCKQFFCFLRSIFFFSFAQCLWCYTNNTCIDYPVRSILPPSSVCALSNARWGVCWSRY